ncbi:MAG: major capsid protein V20 domain-containing protein [Candidatus Fonsibacter sp.]
MNFNNQAGLLSSMTPEQLYKNSVQSGLANMSWDEFFGLSYIVLWY